MENYRTIITRLLCLLCAVLVCTSAFGENKIAGTSTTERPKSKLEQIRDSLETDPESPYWNYMYGHEIKHCDSLNLTSLKKARYYLVKAIQIDDQQFRAKLDMVYIEDMLKHYSSAVCYINELLEFQPYERDLWLRKISLLRKQGNQAEADATMLRMARIFPTDNTVKANSRKIQNEKLLRTGTDFEIFKLEQYFESQKKDSLHPDSAYKKARQLSTLYAETGEYDKAIQSAKKALGLKGQSRARTDTLRSSIAKLLMSKGLYGQALETLDNHEKQGKDFITMRDVLKEMAYDAQLHDPYEAHAKLYSKTNDREALDYLVNTAITRGYYEDALDYMKKRYNPNSTEYLKRRYSLELRVGHEQGAHNALLALYNADSLNSEFRTDYIDMLQRQVGMEIEQGRWVKADKYLEDLYRLDSIRALWPDLMLRRIVVSGRMGDNAKALRLYREARSSDVPHVALYTSAYEDIIATQLKALVDEEKYQEALDKADSLLQETGNSKMALRTCINMSQTLMHHEAFSAYAQKGYELYSDEPYFIIKSAVALGQQQKFDAALERIRPQLKQKDEYAHPLYIATYSGITQDYVNHEFKKLKENPLWTQNERDNINHRVLELTKQALERDSTNKELLYSQGVAYEHLKQWAKAYELQTPNYNPSNAEQREYYQHRDYLLYRTYRERVDVSYIHALYDTRQEDLASTGHLYSIATVAYTHLDSLDAYTGQVSYKGIDGYRDGTEGTSGGAGLEFLAQWEHRFTNRWSGMASVSYSTRYFNKWGASISASYAANKGWTPALRLSYRRTPETYLYLSAASKETAEHEKYNLFILTPSVEKSWRDDRIRTTLNVDMATMKSGVYYNVGLKGKLFFNDDNISSVSLITGFGSFPELSFFEQTALRNVSHTNSMIGFDVQVLISPSFYIGLSGNWNTCYNPYWDGNGVLTDSYRNIYSITAQLHVAF